MVYCSCVLVSQAIPSHYSQREGLGSKTFDWSMDGNLVVCFYCSISIHIE